MRDDVIIAGTSWTPVNTCTPYQLDELVFLTCAAALRDAGVRRHELGVSVTTSLDLYDARSISNALTAPAAGAYLGDELRVEGDVASGIVIAADSIRARQAEVALVCAVSVPEVASVDEHDLRRITEHVSSYTFDSHLDRPVGMTSLVSLALHAARAVDEGATTPDAMAEQTAHELLRADPERGSRRTALTAAEIRDAAPAYSPLTEPMLPAQTAAVGAMVLTSEPRGRRVPRARARLRGWASATSGTLWGGEWLDDPARPTRAAAQRARAHAGLADDDVITSVTMTDLTPALTAPTLQALAVGKDLPDASTNARGTVRTNYPGLANGLLRCVEALDDLAATSAGATPARALVHSVDNLAGLMSSTATVLVLEQM